MTDKEGIDPAFEGEMRYGEPYEYAILCYPDRGRQAGQPQQRRVGRRLRRPGIPAFLTGECSESWSVPVRLRQRISWTLGSLDTQAPIAASLHHRHLRAVFQLDGNSLERRFGGDRRSALEDLAAPGVGPSGAARQVNNPFAHSVLGNGGDEDIGAEEQLVVDIPRLLVFREVEKEWAHRRNAGLACDIHLSLHIRR